jgi:hypothetical protein
MFGSKMLPTSIRPPSRYSLLEIASASALKKGNAIPKLAASALLKIPITGLSSPRPTALL